MNPAEPGHGFGDLTDEIIELVRTRQERIPVLANATGVPLRRHIVHVDDVMQAFDRAIDNPAALGQTFNIAAPAPFDDGVAGSYLSRQLGIPTVRLRCPSYQSFEINITRARSVLGYAPENDFFRMADRAIAARNFR